MTKALATSLTLPSNSRRIVAVTGPRALSSAVAEPHLRVWVGEAGLARFEAPLRREVLMPTNDAADAPRVTLLGDDGSEWEAPAYRDPLGDGSATLWMVPMAPGAVAFRLPDGREFAFGH